MSADLQSRLQSALGDTYRVEKELGGGGMSRVFLADEVRLGRRVVIKVLPPEMGAGVNVERFEREIQLAARLQHPHIVPLLTAGAAGDLLYYIMPFIKGESLRAKLAREGELPVGDAVRILKEVVDALAHAHDEGVVHRDIKPDNVLLSGDHAVVTDFGVAKAVSASTGESHLTSLGVALGTPAYMAPEQAAADPHVDHRADIYAVGVLAYEMLSGRPPFSGSTAQAVLSAHITQAPEPVTTHRETVPVAMSELIVRCLAKKAADRWQRARDMLPHLDALLTPSGGVTPTGTQPVSAVDYAALARQAHPMRVAVLFGIAAAVVLALVYFVMYQLGLPDWVFLGAVLLLAIGLPIMVLTGHHERKRAQARTVGTMVATPTGVRRLFTWRRSVLGGGMAFAGLGVVAAGYMTLRALGIGPAATLVSAGVLEERAPVILADFENRTADSALGPAITDAFRVDFAQSPMVSLLASSEIADVLRSMERDPDASLDLALAREVAMREGIGTVVVGGIDPVGRGYILAASVISASDGEALTAVRETADDDGQIIGAIDRLSAKLRERIGESLKSIRAGAPLGRATTTSLEALQKYSQAIRAAELEADPDKAIALLEEAVALDTAFAMAYRKLGNELRIRGERTRGDEALTKAFAHRDRLTEVERFHVEALYYIYIPQDVERAAAVYRRMVDAYPDSVTAWHNLGVTYGIMREWALSEKAYLEATSRGFNPSYTGAMGAQVAQGSFARAESTLALFAERFPEDPDLGFASANLAFSRGDYDEAAAQVRDLRDRNPANLALRSETVGWLAAFAQHAGRIAEAERHLRDQMRANEERRLPGASLHGAIDLAWLDVWSRERPADGLREIEQALERQPLDSLPPADRPYLGLARLYARADQPEDARRFASEYEEAVDPAIQKTDADRHWAAGEIALAEGRPQDALQDFERWDAEIPGFLYLGPLPSFAEAYDRAGEPDSAIAYYERYLNTPGLFRQFGDRFWHARSYRRLGELYEARGSTAEAVEYYNEFVELWKDADPELQPQVEAVKQRLARLVGEPP
jgi:tetratricopeptide (TPR) repeat protein